MFCRLVLVRFLSDQNSKVNCCFNSWRRCRLDRCLSWKLHRFRRVHWLRVHRNPRRQAQLISSHRQNRLFSFNRFTVRRQLYLAVLSIDGNARLHQHAGRQWTLHRHQTLPFTKLRQHRLSCSPIIYPSKLLAILNSVGTFLEAFRTNKQKQFKLLSGLLSDASWKACLRQH